VSIDKQYPFHGRKIMHSIWGMGQLMFTKCVIVVDKDVDIHDLAEVGWRVLNNIDPKRDVMISDGPYDVLDHASCSVGFGGKMGVDATAKWKEEGYDRGWPAVATMSLDVQARVDRIWRELGIVK
jgi:4-hydroxy-3-polyprenylbenzoate decarboxylase